LKQANLEVSFYFIPKGAVLNLQGCKMDTDGLHNYIPKKKDLIYKRSKIEGNCVIKSTSRSPVKSSSSASRKKKYSVPLNRKKINTIRNKPYNTK
jgi:hypothetical protein